MNIVVLVKQVPDTWAERKLNADDKTLDRASVDVVMNEIDEYAVEEALKIKEADGGEVTILTMGPERAVETIRKALSMGADKAVPLVDDALKGSDAIQTSYAIAKVLDTLEYDLVICGSEATDSRMSVMAALLPERTGNAHLSGARHRVPRAYPPGRAASTAQRRGVAPGLGALGAPPAGHAPAAASPTGRVRWTTT